MPGRKLLPEIYECHFKGGNKQVKGVERGLDWRTVLVIYHHRPQQCPTHRGRGDEGRAWCRPLLVCVFQKHLSFVLCPQLLFVAFPTHISASECSAESSQVQLGGRGCLSCSKLGQSGAGPRRLCPRFKKLSQCCRHSGIKLAQPPHPRELSFPFVKSGEYSAHLPELVCCVKRACVCEKCKIIIHTLVCHPDPSFLLSPLQGESVKFNHYIQSGK